jgi:Mycothiol maleylpyruvate isomerase N-terminal domain
MRLSDLPVTDVREALAVQRGRFIRFLASLDSDQWAAPTVATGWSVKDVCLHLLDVDVSWLARGRDGDTSGMIDVPADHEAFVRALSARNQRWVDGVRNLSPRLIVELLGWSGEELDRYLDSLDLTEPSSVYWAGDVPLWFDLARELTERWTHERQIREAVLACSGQHVADHESPDHFDHECLKLVICTFVWAFPHQYAAAASIGSVVLLDISDVGVWTLTRETDGWTLDEGGTTDPAATLRMAGDAAWRLLTGAGYDTDQVQVSGCHELTEPLTRVRSVIV